jgi:hypothetical protein
MKGCGLYANIHAKKARIKAGSGERMRKPGTKGAPTATAFKKAKKTTKAEAYRKYGTILRAIDKQLRKEKREKKKRSR